MQRDTLGAQRCLGVVWIGVFFVSVCCAATADAVQIRVSQESRAGAGDFHQHILGHIGPVTSEASVLEAYAYNEVSRFSFNGKRPVLRTDVSHLFFVTTGEGLALFIVHDAVDNPDGGTAAMHIHVDGNRNATRLLLRDDAFSESDGYEVEGNGTDFYAWHNWYPCCTDGLVLGPFNGSWKVYVRFIGDTNAPPADVVDGMAAWEALSPGERIRLALEGGRRVLLEPISSFVMRTSPDGPRDLAAADHGPGGTAALSLSPARVPGRWLLRYCAVARSRVFQANVSAIHSR